MINAKSKLRQNSRQIEINFTLSQVVERYQVKFSEVISSEKSFIIIKIFLLI